jgi:predicted nucleic acid-binding protein
VIVFADSSALVTAYAPAEVDVVPDGIVVVSVLARVEVVSALWRKAETGDATTDEALHMVRQFEADWRSAGVASRRYEPLPLRAPVLIRAAALTGTHRLRTLDAIQLASALTARDVEPECRTMVVLDERLRRAAATERFDLLPA